MNDMTLKELRKSLDLTQEAVSKILDIPLRTYKNYENDSQKTETLKYKYLFEKLMEYGRIDEQKGILKLKDIIDTVNDVFNHYKVKYCYLFGSYAKQTATEQSDIDLLISTSISGLDFFGLVETLRTRLYKKVDLLTIDQLKDNQKLLDDILKEGIKIYG